MDDQTSEGRARIEQIQKMIDCSYTVLSTDYPGALLLESGKAVEDAAWLLSLVATLQQQLQSQTEALQEAQQREALYENAQCITCAKHLDIPAESEEYKTYIDQLHGQLKAQGEALETLRAALASIVDDLEARWNMNDPRTNPGIRDNVRNAKAALATVGEPQKEGKR